MPVSIDDLDRLEHMLDIVVEMHNLFDISMEAAAGRFDRYAYRAACFVTGEMFSHTTLEEMALYIYYGKQRWQLKDEAHPMPDPHPQEVTREPFLLRVISAAIVPQTSL